MPVDEEVLLDLVGEAYAEVELERFAPRVLEAIRRVVPSDWASLNDLGPEPSAETIMIPPGPPEIYAVYAQYAHEHPLVTELQVTGDGSPKRISDVVDQETFHATAIYREVYVPLGVEYQVAFTLPARRGHVLAIALSRGDRDYSDEECDLLRRARPHLIQAYRNALEHTALLRRLGLAPALPPADLPAYGLTDREAEV